MSLLSYLTMPLRSPDAKRLHLSDVQWMLFDDFTSQEDLIPWGAINAFLEAHWHDEDLVRMARGNHPVPKATYVEANEWRGRMRLDRFYEEFDRGASLVLENAATGIELVSELEQAYQRFLCEEVASQVFVASSKTTGFGPHWDAYDVFVTQLNGTRDWSIYGITRPAPVLEDYEFPPMPDSPPLARFTMKPGNVLYLPRGCWHDVHPPANDSVHVTVAVSRRTGLDFLQWVMEEVRHADVARSNLPRGADLASQETYLESLQKELSGYLTVDGLRGYLEREDSFAAARPIFSLGTGTSALDGLTATSLVPRARLAPGEDGIDVLADGRQLHIVWKGPTIEILSALTYLLAEGGECRTLRNHLPSLSDHKIVGFVMSLVKLGLISLTEHKVGIADVRGAGG